jgi:hypothetical protein
LWRDIHVAMLLWKIYSLDMNVEPRCELKKLLDGNPDFALWAGSYEVKLDREQAYRLV